MNDMSAQREALMAAEDERRRWLRGIRDGIYSPLDVVDEASSNLPLRTLQLESLFAVYDSSGKQWPDVRIRLLGVLGIAVRAKHLTVGWVIDPRAGGRRYYAFVDAVRPRDQPPWPGFPWPTPDEPRVRR